MGGHVVHFPRTSVDWPVYPHVQELSCSTALSLQPKCCGSLVRAHSQCAISPFCRGTSSLQLCSSASSPLCKLLYSIDSSRSSSQLLDIRGLIYIARSDQTLCNTLGAAYTRLCVVISLATFHYHRAASWRIHHTIHVTPRRHTLHAIQPQPARE